MFREPAEISLGWGYIPPFALCVLGGLLSAWAVAQALNACGLSRWFIHPPLTFIAFWVLATSLIGLFVVAP